MAQSGYIRGKADYEFWMRQVRLGMQYRKKVAFEADWDTWRKYYRNQFAPGQVPVNLFYRMLRTTVPSIYMRNPSITIIPTKPGAEQAAFAKLIEQADNKLLRTMKMKRQIKKIIHNTWMFGSGFGKLGFGAEYNLTPSMFEDNEAPSGSTNKQEFIEYNANVRAEMPWFLSSHPSNIILPEGLEDYDQARWVGVWVERDLWDVQRDPRLKNTGDLKAGSGRDILRDRPSKHKDNPDVVDLLEIHDKKSGEVFIFAPYISKKSLFQGEDRLQVNGHLPVKQLIFDPNDDSAWGLPASVILEPQQLEINETRTLQMKLRRLAMVKLLARRNAIREEELEKILDGNVTGILQVDGDGPLGDAIDKLVLGDVPSSLFSSGQELLNDVKETMGFSRNQWGEFGGQRSHSAPTAFETQVVAQSAEVRNDERRDSVADMLEEVFEDIHSIIFDYWKEEQVVQVMGPEATPVWVKFRPSVLKAARFSFQIEPGSSAPETREVREQKAVSIYDKFKDNPLIDPQLLTTTTLRELKGVQYDHMVRQMSAMGGPGGSPATALGLEQFVQMLAQSPQAVHNGGVADAAV